VRRGLYLPTPDQVLAALQAVDSGEGTLMIVKNYTGDVMNFEMAGEARGGRRHRGHQRRGGR
jgi:dihydroxyacetone kinase